MRESDHEVSPRGEGNVVSVEFNLLYRWHATLSQHDTQWTTEMFDNIFEGESPDEVSCLSHNPLFFDFVLIFVHFSRSLLICSKMQLMLSWFLHQMFAIGLSISESIKSKWEHDHWHRILFSLKRNAEKRFNDADLAEIIQGSTGHIAGAFQARGTPAALRVIEVLGIEQSRSWGVCSVCHCNSLRDIYDLHLL